MADAARQQARTSGVVRIYLNSLLGCSGTPPTALRDLDGHLRRSHTRAEAQQPLHDEAVQLG